MHGLTVGQKDRGIHGSGQYRGRERVGVVIGACQDDGVRFGKGIFGQSDRRLNPVVAENAFGGDACGRCGRRGRCGRFRISFLRPLRIQCEILCDGRCKVIPCRERRIDRVVVPAKVIASGDIPTRFVLMVRFRFSIRSGPLLVSPVSSACMVRRAPGAPDILTSPPWIHYKIRHLSHQSCFLRQIQHSHDTQINRVHSRL